MVSVFPNIIAKRAVTTYAVTLILVSLFFMSHAMGYEFIAIGLTAVAMFFFGVSSLSKSAQTMGLKKFTTRIFWIAFSIRLCWVIFSYFFYTYKNGQPFEWGMSDSLAYHEAGEWLAELPWQFALDYWGGFSGISDLGYPGYLTLLYKIIGPNIFVVRLIKCLLNAATCIFIYKLADRMFGVEVGKLAAIFCALMPNFIYYCGLHTKEIEMTFLAVAFIERADYALRSRIFSVKTLGIVLILAFSLFFFRTVLGVVAIMSFVAALFITSDKIAGKARKVTLGVVTFFFVLTLAGGTVRMEVEKYWDLRVVNEVQKRSHQSRTAKWAKYATGTVMAPMIVVLPLATMVDTGQYNQNVVHGGNFVKNTMAIFVILALYYAFKNKKWKDYSLVGAFVLGYLAIISFSGYANAERFHIPTLPLLLVMAAYGVSQLNMKNFKYVNIWLIGVVLMQIAWAYFKLGSRGVLE